MPAERTTMRQVREVLRLKFVGGVPTREIARRLGVAASTVRATLKRFTAGGPRCEFVSNVDGNHLHDLLEDADAAATLFIVASKKCRRLQTAEVCATLADRDMPASLRGNLPHHAGASGAAHLGGAEKVALHPRRRLC